MSWDLVIGSIAITVLSVLAYLVGSRFGARRSHPRGLYFLASLAVALFFSCVLGGKLAWASLIPRASVIYWSNWLPILISLTAGLANSTVVLSSPKRAATALMLLVLTSGYILMPVARPAFAPALTSDKTNWKGDVCLQSHGSTCAPAAAAILLKTANIDTTESDMVKRCLTSDFGTEPLGLFRGIALATQSSIHRPSVASSDPDNWHGLFQFPNVALVEFPQDHAVEASGWNVFASRFFSGPRREGHAIVVLGRNVDGSWAIADPAFGLTDWSDREFKARFTGDAIHLQRDLSKDF